MNEFSRQTNGEFMAFKHFAEAALEANPKLLRLDCLNPIKAIPHEFDYSFTPDIDLKTAWKQYLNVRFDHCVFSQGVRDSLYGVFDFLKATGVVLDMPADVYPVYQMMANKVGLQYRAYRTLPSYDVTEFQGAVALITAPRVPSGADLTEDDVQTLSAWLGESKDQGGLFEGTVRGGDKRIRLP